MRSIAKGSPWDLYLQYQKDTGRIRPEVELINNDAVRDYIAWLEDQFADHFASQQYARQITDILEKHDFSFETGV